MVPHAVTEVDTYTHTHNRLPYKEYAMAKRNPQDATLRNVRAARTRETKLEARMTQVEAQVSVLAQSVRLLAMLINSSTATTIRAKKPRKG